MIDEEWIAKARAAYEVGVLQGVVNDSSEFETGANWALQEFKKFLWHDASEEPEPDKLLLLETEVKKKVCYHIHTRSNIIKLREYKGFVEGIGLKRWCYLSDLLPKEGGEQ